MTTDRIPKTNQDSQYWCCKVTLRQWPYVDANNFPFKCTDVVPIYVY